MYLIYSCVFFNEDYCNLLNLLLKSYVLFGRPNNSITYLVITSQSMKDIIKNMCESLNIKYDIWCLELYTKFEACYSRLKIFDYPNIHNYSKILYLDTDILITNNINNIFDFELLDIIYTLKEGNTNDVNWGYLWKENNPNIEAFTSGIILFNQVNKLEKFFKNTLSSILNFITNNKNVEPPCYDQPFIVYEAITKNFYNNTRLFGLVVNNPENFNNEIISHFPGGVGWYESKIEKMNKYLRYLINLENKNNNFYDKLLNKSYYWGDNKISFLDNYKMNAFGNGNYRYINNDRIIANFGGRTHTIYFNNEFTYYISIRHDDFCIVQGNIS